VASWERFECSFKHSLKAEAELVEPSPVAYKKEALSTGIKMFKPVIRMSAPVNKLTLFSITQKGYNVKLCGFFKISTGRAGMDYDHEIIVAGAGPAG